MTIWTCSIAERFGLLSLILLLTWPFRPHLLKMIVYKIHPVYSDERGPDIDLFWYLERVLNGVDLLLLFLRGELAKAKQVISLSGSVDRTQMSLRLYSLS
jgi:hypothetical protein